MRLLTRVNPNGFCDSSLHSSRETGEVGVQGMHWVVDQCLDEIHLNSHEGNDFGSQEELWESLASVFETSSSASVLALGGHNSGKSYTLFGDNTEDNRGLVHRYIDWAFSLNPAGETYALLSMFIIDSDESIVDVLDNCKLHSFQGNVGTLSPIGARALPVVPKAFNDSARCREAFRLGALASSVYRSGKLSPGTKTHFVIQLSHFQSSLDGTPSRLRYASFVEVSSLDLPAEPRPADDNLTGTTLRNISARSLRGILHSHSLVQSASVLAYFLHDALLNVHSFL